MMAESKPNHDPWITGRGAAVHGAIVEGASDQFPHSWGGGMTGFGTSTWRCSASGGRRLSGFMRPGDSYLPLRGTMLSPHTLAYLDASIFR